MAHSQGTTGVPRDTPPLTNRSASLESPPSEEISVLQEQTACLTGSLWFPALSAHSQEGWSLRCGDQNQPHRCTLEGPTLPSAYQRMTFPPRTPSLSSPATPIPPLWPRSPDVPLTRRVQTVLGRTAAGRRVPQGGRSCPAGV